MKNLQDILNRIPLKPLQKEEKNAMRTRLIDFMNVHPSLSTKRPALSSFFFEMFSVRLLANALPAALVLALVVGGSISFAAEGALPGDLLYPVKVSVNESVRGAIAISSEAKTEWNSELIERRLQEAEELANEGKLDEDTRSEIESNIETHFADIETRISAEGDNDRAAEVSSRLETALRGHEQILLEISKGGGKGESITLAAKVAASLEDVSEAEALAQTLRSKAEAISKTRTEAEISVSSRVNGQMKKSAENSLRSAEKRISEARKLLKKNKATLNAEISAQIEAQMQAAEESITEGKTRVEAEASGEAFVLFQEAQRLADEARLTTRAARDFDVRISIRGIDISTAMTLDAGEEDDEEEDQED